MIKNKKKKIQTQSSIETVKLEFPRYRLLCHTQGWKYRLVIDNRYYILCFSAIDYRRCFAFNFFYRLSRFLCVLLTFYRLIKSLHFTFVLVESA